MVRSSSPFHSLTLMSPPTPSGFSISRLAIRRHIGTLMLTLALVVVGVFSLLNLQVDLLPAITYPRIGVRLSAPGVSPEVAVNEITKPLEEALSATEGVVQLYSLTREGQVSLDLFFEPGGDIDQALNEATAAFNRAQGNLPAIVQAPRLFKLDPSQQPIYELALTSDQRRPVDLRIFGDEELARELNVIPGVAAVDVTGGVQEEVRVTLDMNRLQALGVGLRDVLTELRAANQDVSGGRLLSPTAEPLTRAIGRFRGIDEIETLSFTPAAGGSSPAAERRVFLRDVATVTEGTKAQRIYVSLNGQPAVKVSILKQPDANTVEVVRAVKRRIEALQQNGTIPADLQLIPTLDESVFINNSLNTLTEAALWGAGLAMLAVLIFVGSLRQTFIIGLTIPLCLLAAAIAMALSGFSLNVFSLAGLAISIGQAVDTSIVILENVAKRSAAAQQLTTAQSGDRTMGAIALVEESAGEMESSLIAATGTNLVAVLPFVMVGGFVALLFNELILTICFAVGASLIVAITIVPMLASRLLLVRRSSGLSRTWLIRGFQQRFDGMTQAYARLLEQVVRRRGWVVAIALIVLGGSSWWMVGQLPQEILPRINTGQARLIAQFPPGTPLENNRKVMEAADQILRDQPETEYTFTTAGGFLFGSNTIENPLRGSSSITLKPGSDVEAYVERVSRELSRLNLVETRLRVVPGEVRGLQTSNSPIRGGADIDLIFQGDNEQDLNQAGRQILKALEEQATLARYRPDGDRRQPEVQIRLDPVRAAQLGITIENLGETLETAIQGSVPTQLQRGDRLVDVRVELDDAQMQTPSQLARLPLFTENNQLVRLGNVARIEMGEAPGEIQRINQRRVFLIAGNLNEGASLSAALAEANRILASLDLPAGVTRLPSAAAQSNQQIQSALPSLGGLAAFLVFVVMAVQYNSLIDPLVIMGTLPLALTGGIWGLYVTRTAVGATVIVGAVLLVGIVVNNAIIMVETANQVRARDGGDRRVAILKAAPQRLRPILMTTITTVLGMFPLALGLGEGSEFLQPLGIVVFAGMSVATLLTLFLIPCFYLLLHDWSAGGASPLENHPSSRDTATQDAATFEPVPLPATDPGDRPSFKP